jgi:flagellar biosynthesis/type III secretory pathway M-ring protein FliF/YscJ
MTAGLLIGAFIVAALLVAGVAVLQRARAEPAARAVERAPDPAEEREAEAASTPRSGVLAERGND